MARAVFTLLLVSVFSAAAIPLRAQSGDAASSDYVYHPPSPQKSVEIGNFYLRRDNYPGALSRFQEAVQDDPHYAPAYLGLGKVYEKMGKRKEALRAYERYLRELPSDRDAAKAKGVHKAIARLEGELAAQHPSSRRAESAHK